jgi:MFS family permease
MASHALRQARVLALCQALYTSALSVDLTLTGLVGYTLAPNKALATLPFALITVASALTAIAAAFLIERLGRRPAFCLGALACMAGGLVSVLAIWRHDFVLFVSVRRWSECSRHSRASIAWPPPMPRRLPRSRGRYRPC